MRLALAMPFVGLRGVTQAGHHSGAVIPRKPPKAADEESRRYGGTPRAPAGTCGRGYAPDQVAARFIAPDSVAVLRIRTECQRHARDERRSCAPHAATGAVGEGLL